MNKILMGAVILLSSTAVTAAPPPTTCSTQSSDEANAKIQAAVDNALATYGKTITPPETSWLDGCLSQFDSGVNGLLGLSMPSFESVLDNLGSSACNYAVNEAETAVSSVISGGGYSYSAGGFGVTTLKGYSVTDTSRQTADAIWDSAVK